MDTVKKLEYNQYAKDHSVSYWKKERDSIIARLDCKIGGYAEINVSKNSIGAVGLAIAKLKKREDTFIYRLEQNERGYYIIRYDGQIKFNL